jgi:hypothetical protein
MQSSEKEEILKLPIEQSPLSPEFKAVSEMLGFHIFADLLAHRTNKLQSLPGFDQHLVYEYVEYFEHNKLGYLIDP